mmetsp:Transcript_4819/g.11186  ORF Transcript_4819/g.11186 Transcript_4819/m.11186 type:complete len:265 (-) Transcript_4819:685-1479(-)
MRPRSEGCAPPVWTPLKHHESDILRPLAQSPAARLNFASSHTSLPSACAFASLLPAPGPAIRMSMLADTAPRIDAPAAAAAAEAAARGTSSVPVKTIFLPPRPPARALALGAAGAGEAARLAAALALGAGEAARAFALGSGLALAFALGSALALALAAALLPFMPVVWVSASYLVLLALRCFAYSSAVTSKRTCVPGGMTRLAEVDWTKSRWPSRMSLGPFLSSPSGQPRALRHLAWPTVNLSALTFWSSISLYNWIFSGRATA